MPAEQPQQPMMMMPPPQQMAPAPAAAPVQLVQNSDFLLMNRNHDMIRN